MKQAAFSIAAIAIVILVVAALFSISGRSAREKDLDSAVRESAREALDQCVTLRYGDDMLDLIFRQLLIDKLADTDDEGQKLHIDIHAADAGKGLLSVSVCEEFTYPNKKTGQVKSRCTVILEEEKPKETYVVRYLIPWQEARELGLCYIAGEDTEYASYLVEKGMELPVPAAWKDSPGKKTVREDMEIHGHII